MYLAFLAIVFGIFSGVPIQCQRQNNWCSSCDDPHITTFDALEYEFHELGQHYILYTDFDNTLVTASYMPCAEDSTLSCNCAVYVKNRDTVLFMDMCGVSTLNQALKFSFAIKGRYRAYTALCDTKLVHPSDETNNAWWNRPGNAVSINTRLLCAKMMNTNTYVIRTNNANMETNIFVRIIVHDLGISCVFIKPSSSSYRNTGGLCGLWNGDENDDGYILGQRQRKIYLDLPYDTSHVAQMGNFWRLTKFAKSSQRFKFFETDLFCPCDTPSDSSYDDDVPFWLAQESGRFCANLVSKCIYSSDIYTPCKREAIRRVRATSATLRDAVEMCRQNILQPDIKQVVNAQVVDIDPIMKMCVDDFKKTNDMYWSLTQADLARNLAIINIEQAKKSLRSGRLDIEENDVRFNSVIYNQTLYDLLIRPISERFDNYTQILNLGEDV